MVLENLGDDEDQEDNDWEEGEEAGTFRHRSTGSAALSRGVSRNFSIQKSRHGSRADITEPSQRHSVTFQPAATQ